MRSPGLAALELKRFGRGKLPRAALVAVTLLPLLYGALYLWSFWDPYGRLDRIPVALVNDDRGAFAAGRKISAGDEITRGLRDSEVFAWHEVSAAEARRGVEDGSFYLSLTMPADLSERIASSSGDAPETGALQVRTNDANNYIVGQLSRTVFSEVRTAASTNASRSFLDRIFISFSGIHDSTERAAKGADQLRSGISRAQKGSEDLADGLRTAKDGSGELAGGLRKLNKGAGDLETGAQQVADGTQSLADKVNGVADDVRPYLRDNGKTIAESARLVADSAQAVRDNLGVLVKAAPAAATGARQASAELDGVYRTRCEEQPVPDTAVCPPLQRARTAAADVAVVADDLNTLVRDDHGDLKSLDGRLATLREQAQALAEHAPRLDEDLEGAVTKINALNTGAWDVAQGADRLHTGIAGAKKGASALDTGVGELKSGADTLDGGIFALADGSAELAGGLSDGVAKIPDYDKEDRDRRTEVMADPVQLASRSLHPAPNYGTGFAPYFIPLSLWVGAMVAYMLIQPLNRRALAVGAAARRIALAGWLPVAAIGLLQAGALLSVLHWAIGLEMAHAAGTAAFLILVTCCFAAIVQWLNACFGAAGRILVLALLMLQLTSAGGTYPVQTSPGFFGAIHPFLPMSYVVEALRRLITGGGLGPVWGACGVLAAFTAGALVLTTVSARRKQVWTFDRLHPELSL
ncbi:YhgE/Pip domain-containing protein [Streptomyces sp. AK02-01A]|uniref:YhgE/Pip domain-containing protein n=1 Tax=Streptomyces sp. AK02-01A TaxID=3028648 RepID=UPI0029AC023C|nr:YhgE/Pip domain-containing protein [Streptomyces sp. AK02-01A]MDX3852880.1 YhgE/Pip domain-containing protein [Streptomyces sp. AK02-01A]